MTATAITAGTIIPGSIESVQVFTANGTWTKPAGISMILVECLAGGGGGGSANITSATQAAAGGGGGAGGYGTILIDVSAISSETVTIGAAGAAGTGGGAGGTGGTSSFGAHLSSTGGVGGNAGTAATTFGTVNGGAPGLAAGGITGGYRVDRGTPGMRYPADNCAMRGKGAESPYGVGGNFSTTATTLAGSAGVSYGAGGSGGANANSQAATIDGGAGTQGIIIVWEYR